jgi:hypothetical protein
LLLYLDYLSQWLIVLAIILLLSSIYTQFDAVDEEHFAHQYDEVQNASADTMREQDEDQESDVGHLCVVHRAAQEAPVHDDDDDENCHVQNAENASEILFDAINTVNADTMSEEDEDHISDEVFVDVATDTMSEEDEDEDHISDEVLVDVDADTEVAEAKKKRFEAWKQKLVQKRQRGEYTQHLFDHTERVMNSKGYTRMLEENEVDFSDFEYWMAWIFLGDPRTDQSGAKKWINGLLLSHHTSSHLKRSPIARRTTQRSMRRRAAFQQRNKAHQRAQRKEKKLSAQRHGRKVHSLVLAVEETNVVVEGVHEVRRTHSLMRETEAEQRWTCCTVMMLLLVCYYAVATLINIFCDDSPFDIIDLQTLLFCFFIDLVASLPLDIIITVLSGGGGSGSSGAQKDENYSCVSHEATKHLNSKKRPDFEVFLFDGVSWRVVECSTHNTVHHLNKIIMHSFSKATMNDFYILDEGRCRYNHSQLQPGNAYECRWRVRGGTKEVKEQREKPPPRYEYKVAAADEETSTDLIPNSVPQLIALNSREDSVASTVVLSQSCSDDAMTTTNQCREAAELLIKIKHALLMEKHATFSDIRQQFVKLATQVHEEGGDRWDTFKDTVSLTNTSDHAVSLWLLAENDPFSAITLLEWPAKQELLQETCAQHRCQVIKKEFVGIGLSATQWRQILSKLSTSDVLYDVGNGATDIIAAQTDTIKLRSIANMRMTRHMPDYGAAVQIKLVLNESRQMMTVEVATVPGWASIVIDALFEAVWQDDKLHYQLKEAMRQTFCGTTDGLRFIVIAVWRERYPAESSLLLLGLESSDPRRIDFQCRTIKNAFKDAYHKVLYYVMQQYFDKDGRLEIRRRADRYAELCRQVPAVVHSLFYPLPFTPQEVLALRVHHSFDFRRKDAKWVLAVVIKDCPTTLVDQVRIQFRDVNDEIKKQNVPRLILCDGARGRHAGHVTSRPVKRKQMLAAIEKSRNNAKPRFYVSVKVPSFYYRLSNFCQPKDLVENWHNAEVLTWDRNSGQVQVQFEPHLCEKEGDAAAPAVWVHPDNVIEVALVNAEAQLKAQRRSEKWEKNVQRMSEECPAMDVSRRRVADSGDALAVHSVSGFLTIHCDQHVSKWTDIAVIGKLNPLPALLLQITRGTFHPMGSHRSKVLIFLHFSSSGYISVHLKRSLLNGNPVVAVDEDSPDSTPDQVFLEGHVSFRCLIAPIAQRVRQHNMSQSANAPPRYTTQLHESAIGQEALWLDVAHRQGIQGVVLFGETDDPDLWRPRVAQQIIHRRQVLRDKKHTTEIQVSRCLGTMKCTVRACSQYNKICAVPSPATQKKKGRHRNWDVCTGQCQQPMKVAQCANYVFDFKQSGHLTKDSQFRRIIITAGRHHPDCACADYHSKTTSTFKFLQRHLSWGDWNIVPKKLAIKTFSLHTQTGLRDVKSFVLGQVDPWFSGTHYKETVRTVRRYHLADLKIRGVDIHCMDNGIPNEFNDTVQYVDTKTSCKLIVMYHPYIMQRLAAEIIRKRCGYFEDPDFMAEQIEANPLLVDVVLPMVGMKDATFDILRGHVLKLIDSVVWSNECEKFIYFSFCITNVESIAAFFVSFCLELMVLQEIVGSLMQIAHCLRYIFDLCTKCRVGFNIAWAALHLEGDEVRRARDESRLCQLFDSYAPRHDFFQGWTQEWFGKVQIPFTIQPDRVHVDSLFLKLRRLVPSDKRNAFMEAAHYLTSALELEEGMKRLSQFVEKWQNVPALAGRCALLLSPYYIRHVFHWGRNVCKSHVLSYVTYSTSNPIESLHNLEKVASSGGGYNVLGVIELVRAMLLEQTQANFYGKVHKHGHNHHQMRYSAVKGVKRYRAQFKKQSEFAAGRLDRCRKRNIGNIKCLYKLDMNLRAGNPRGMNTRIYVYGWKNNVYSADTDNDFNVSTLGLLYPGINSKSAKSKLDDADHFGFLGKFITVIEHWSSDECAPILHSMTQRFLDFAEHTTTRTPRISTTSWRQHHAALMSLKKRTTITDRLLEMFQCANLTDFAEMTLTELTEDENWKTFCDDHHVHWLGSDADQCWARVADFHTWPSFEEMAKRLQRKEYTHSYIVHLHLGEEHKEWFVFKLINLEDKHVWCWYTPFANQNNIKGKGKVNSDNAGLWRRLHAVEREIALALFCHAGALPEDKALSKLLTLVIAIWSAFDQHSAEFAALCEAANTERFKQIRAEAEVEGGVDMTAQMVWYKVSRDEQVKADCISAMDALAENCSRNIADSIRSTRFAVATERVMRRLLQMYKSHVRMHPRRWLRNRAQIVNVRHRLHEIRELIEGERSRVLKGMIKRGVAALDLNFALSADKRSSRENSRSLSQQLQKREHQLLPELAIAQDQIMDEHGVDVMRTSSCHTDQAVPIRIEFGRKQCRQLNKSSSNMTQLDLLKLVTRTQDEMIRGIVHSPLVCWESRAMEDDTLPWIQCSQCPMKVHLKCAQIDELQARNADRERLSWLCFACMGMVQINFTASVFEKHACVDSQRRHRDSRNHLLKKVNRNSNVYVCALELRERVALMMYLALWLTPLRVALSDNGLFASETSDAFMFGSVLQTMMENNFLSREQLVSLRNAMSHVVRLSDMLALLLDAHASVCHNIEDHITGTFVDYDKIDTEQHIRANITIVRGVCSDDSRTLFENQKVGRLIMIITPVFGCILVDEVAAAAAIRIQSNLVITECDWTKFPTGSLLIFWAANLEVADSTALRVHVPDGFESPVLIASAENEADAVMASPQQPLNMEAEDMQQVAQRRMDITKFIKSALCYGQRTHLWIGDGDLSVFNQNRKVIVKQRCLEHIAQRGGTHTAIIKDGNCLVRCLAVLEGTSHEVSSTPAHLQDGSHEWSMQGLQALRERLCREYFRQIELNHIMHPCAEEMKECTQNGKHLSQDFVRAYHLKHQRNVYILQYNDTFDDLDAHAFVESDFRHNSPFFILRESLGAHSYHYEFIQFSNAIQTVRELTSQARAAPDGAVNAFCGFRTYHCWRNAPLREKFHRLKVADEKVWHWLEIGHIVDHTKVGKEGSKYHSTGTSLLSCQSGTMSSSSLASDIQECEAAGQDTESIASCLFHIPPFQVKADVASQCTAQELMLVCGYARKMVETFTKQMTIATNMPNDVVQIILEMYYRRYDEWELCQTQTHLGILSNFCGRVPVLHNRPAKTDGEFWQRFYRQNKKGKDVGINYRKVKGFLRRRNMCVMQYYNRRDFEVCNYAETESTWSNYGGTMELVDLGAMCKRTKGAVQCPGCNLFIHPECSLTPQSPTCPWCVFKLDRVFEIDPKVLTVTAACGRISMHDSVPMDLSSAHNQLHNQFYEQGLNLESPSGNQEMEVEQLEDQGDATSESTSDFEHDLPDGWHKQHNHYVRPKSDMSVAEAPEVRHVRQPLLPQNPAPRSMSCSALDKQRSPSVPIGRWTIPAGATTMPEQDSLSLSDLDNFAWKGPTEPSADEDEYELGLAAMSKSVESLSRVAEQFWNKKGEKWQQRAARTMLHILDLLTEIKTEFGENGFKKVLRKWPMRKSWFQYLRTLVDEKEPNQIIITRLAMEPRKTLIAVMDFYPQLLTSDKYEFGCSSLVDKPGLAYPILTDAKQQQKQDSEEGGEETTQRSRKSKGKRSFAEMANNSSRQETEEVEAAEEGDGEPQRKKRKKSE